MFTTAGNTIQNQVVELCGDDNIFAKSPTPWPQVSREQVLTRHPELIIAVGDDQLMSSIRAFWSHQLTVPIITIHDDWFSRAGPRILLAAQSLCQRLQSIAPHNNNKKQPVLIKAYQQIADR